MSTATPSDAVSGSNHVSMRWVEMMSRLVSHFDGRPAPITASSPIRYQLRRVFGTMQREPLSQPPVDVELVDISSRGVCLLSETPLQVGERLTLHMPDPAGRSTGWAMVVAHVGVLADGKTRAGLMRDG
ncbi:MAG: PilZ domain-containing protein [Phycisphaerae bacterium]|nr:PilZ domain-containing protein [Phycisphaerae bacterium]